MFRKVKITRFEEQNHVSARTKCHCLARLGFPDSGTHRDQCPRSFAPLNCRESRATGLLPKATPLGVLGNRAHRRPPDAAWERCSPPNGPYRVQLPYRIHPLGVPLPNRRRTCARFLFPSDGSIQEPRRTPPLVVGFSARPSGFSGARLPVPLLLVVKPVGITSVTALAGTRQGLRPVGLRTASENAGLLLDRTRRGAVFHRV